MRKLIILILTGVLTCSTFGCINSLEQNDHLRFNPDVTNTEKIIELADGVTVKYRAYENIYYITNVLDSTYQYLNLYVLESAYDLREKAPIFLKTNIGGYMAVKAGSPSQKDATRRALQEEYVVVISGSRGANSIVSTNEGKVYTGRDPAGFAQQRALTPEQTEISNELVTLYPAYLNSLELKISDGTFLTDDSYKDYIF